jgi:hypothetical protein
MLKAKVEVAKKRGSNPKMKAQYMKRARRGMMGFTIVWSDSDPFTENGRIDGGEIDHANPTQKLICRDMWKRCSQWIVSTEFTWRVIMRVVFVGAPKGDCYYDNEFTYTCTLRGHKSEILNDAMEQALKEAVAGNDAYPDGHKNKGVYSACEFLAQVVGV